MSLTVLKEQLGFRLEESHLVTAACLLDYLTLGMFINDK